MVAVAYVLAVGGIIALIWGGLQKFKAGRLASAPFLKTGDAASRGEAAAGPKGEASAEGDVECPAPLTAPASGTPCLYYRLKVVGYWKEGDSEKSKDYLDEQHAATFSLNDGSGSLAIDGSQGGDFDCEKTFEETKKEGFLADLKGAIGKGEPIVFGQYSFHNPTMSTASKFKCTEEILRVHPRLYACGKLTSSVLGAPSWTSLILSPKGREELLGSAAKTAKLCLAGGAAAVVVGTIVGVIGNMSN